jgi:hypothetical protein
MSLRSALLWLASGVSQAAAWGLFLSPIQHAAEAEPGPAAEGAQRAAVVGEQHPARPVLERAQEAVARMEREIRDYTATLVRRERYEGTLGDRQSIPIKIRHNPLCVYANFEQTNNPRVVEVIYIDGQNMEENEPSHMFVHSDLPIFGRSTRMLNPHNKTWAMRGERRPVTDIGILNLAHWMARDAKQDLQHADCEVSWSKDAKVEGRASTCVQTVRPARREDAAFHKTRFFIDEQLAVPIRFEAYDWPAAAGAEPELLEEYTYHDLKVNVGLSERAFDYRNPDYGFPRSVKW